MQTFRNLRLAVRLGVAFGALALGLVIVAAVAFASAGQNRTALGDLTQNDVAALELAAAPGERTQAIGHKTASRMGAEAKGLVRSLNDVVRSLQRDPAGFLSGNRVPEYRR